MPAQACQDKSENNFGCCGWLGIALELRRRFKPSPAKAGAEPAQGGNGVLETVPAQV
jgi:hypothetical protein